MSAGLSSRMGTEIWRNRQEGRPWAAARGLRLWGRFPPSAGGVAAGAYMYPLISRVTVRGLAAGFA